MPYDGEPGIDDATGLIRMYNSPALLDLFLALSFVAPKYFGRRVNIYRGIYLIALVCTLGRTGIFSTLMTVVLSMLFLGKASKIFKTLAILGILLVPFIGMISNRFEGGDTSGDLSALTSGAAFNDYDMGGGEGGTMTYRIAWVYERFDYLINRPIGEQIFGLGLISDSQPIVYKKYNFRIGLANEEVGRPYQLVTPDIAYGNLLSRLGFAGGIIYLCFLVSLAVFLYKNRKANSLAIVGTSMLIMLFLLSFAGSALSEPQNLIVYFIAMATIFQKYNEYPFKRESGKALFNKIL